MCFVFIFTRLGNGVIILNAQRKFQSSWNTHMNQLCQVQRTIKRSLGNTRLWEINHVFFSPSRIKTGNGGISCIYWTSDRNYGQRRRQDMQQEFSSTTNVSVLSIFLFWIVFLCYEKKTMNGKTHYNCLLSSQHFCLLPSRWQLLEGRKRSVVLIMFYSLQILEKMRGGLPWTPSGHDLREDMFELQRKNIS